MSMTNHPHILIAEDEVHLQVALKFYFQRKGCIVSQTKTGTEALQIIHSSRAQDIPIDLLVTDIRMPEMDGECLLRAIREFDADLPVLVMTGFGNKELVVSLLRLGCSDYIEKPFQVDVLNWHVSQLLQRAQLKKQAK